MQSQEKDRRKTRRSAWMEDWVCNWKKSHREESGKSMRKCQHQGIEIKYPNIKGTRKELSWYEFIHSFSLQFLCVFQVTGNLGTAWFSEKVPVFAQPGLPQPTFWCGFKSVSTSFLFCCMKRLNGITVCNTIIELTYLVYPFLATGLQLCYISQLEWMTRPTSYQSTGREHNPWTS